MITRLGGLPFFKVGAGGLPVVVGLFHVCSASNQVGMGSTFALARRQTSHQHGLLVTRTLQGRSQTVSEFALLGQSRRQPPPRLQRSLLHFAGSSQLRKLRFHRRQQLPSDGFFLQLGIDLGQSAPHQVQLTLDGFAAFDGPFAVDFPSFEPQNTRQNTLAVRRALLGKLVGLALQKKRRIDESLIVQPKNVFDTVLSIAQGVFSERPPCDDIR